MSVPTSMRVGPFVPTILPKKRYITFYIFLFWISLIPILIQFWFYWQILGDINTPVEHKRLTHFYLYLPLFLFIWYVETILISLVFAKILLTIVSFIHKPKEGVFLRDKKNKDYKYWCIRNIIKKWPVWLAHKFPFPFLDNICFKVFGVKTKFSNSLFEGWVDTEFIEFGKNVVIGQGSHIQSSIIMGKFLIIKKTIIENDVRIGVHSVVMPGTHIGEKAVLGTFCLTTIGQKLEEGWIYHGNPAKKFKKNRFFEDGLEKKIKFKVHDEESLIIKHKKFYGKKEKVEHMHLKERLKRRRKQHREEKKNK